MDLGLEAAGFRHVGCIEWDEAARRSLKANRDGKWPVLSHRDVRDAARELRPADLGLEVGELDLLAGAPPCQPYSKAAQWAPGSRQGLEDPRGRYLDDFLSLVETFLPKAVLMENVRGFVAGSTSALAHLQEHLAGIADRTGHEYRVQSQLLDAADYGVPQRRVRAIVVLTRLQRPFEWPGRLEPRVAWDAIGRLPAPPDEVDLRAKGKWADLLPSIPEGSNYLWHTSRGGGLPLFGYRTRYWSFLLKLAKDEPSWTLPASPGPSTGPFHWENRPLTPQELLALQSFPSDWRVEGTRRLDQVRQIGNATPPLLAEVVGRSLVAHLTGLSAATSPPVLTIRRCRPIAEASPVIEVPTAYHGYIGDHADHPGNGKGPGVRRATKVASAGRVDR